MTVEQQTPRQDERRTGDTLSRERANELVRAWASGRPGPLGSVLGRLT
ncbi:MAG: hypothetical protein HY263_04955, partial [Chloroflexi bacterium]|nr:hypothetical protein [Chloroflexota bacterium]